MLLGLEASNKFLGTTTARFSFSYARHSTTVSFAVREIHGTTLPLYKMLVRDKCRTTDFQCVDGGFYFPCDVQRKSPYTCNVFLKIIFNFVVFI